MKKKLFSWPLKIVIYGQKGQGKTTFANLLHGELNRRISFPSNIESMDDNSQSVFHRISFAKPIKELLSLVYNIKLETIDEWKNKNENFPEWNKTMRQAMQHTGDLLRSIDPYTFTKIVNSFPFNAIIDDGRFDNERQYALDRGWMGMLVRRPGHENWSPEHESEKDSAMWYRMWDEGHREALHKAGFHYLISAKSIGELTGDAAAITDDIIDGLRNAGAIK